ncbi:ABC transporter ATP-binding protein [Nesterenkonia xinjiangensis]|uniref:Iron complex transport system ATP-binding protein n=1 Tax=Nesterenkonia xinjiangensis TaxID=225327 RepID=A0A7Z0GJX4_9MICC|nr:ABC transporter ATP-binding protein [Nesterenkonia xinjiangensis]NYJ77307.1 iron complex transport system ATP-binding protein [Nesterenkonia xinjiangensis]
MTTPRRRNVPTGPASPAGADPLVADTVTLQPGDTPVSSGLRLEIARGSFTVIIGPNACGKSTLLRALAGLLTPEEGRILLDGSDLRRWSARQAASRLGLLPQTATSPDGIGVSELVARGRFAHQRLLRQWSADDQHAVDEALRLTGTEHLAARRVDELSGGQRQRVWIAMVLAQQSPTILLDEPTTYLDISHQLEVLNVLHALHLQGRTIVVVLHDLNQAARYADRLVVMRQGKIVAEGDPQRVLTTELVREVFELPNRVVPDPVTGTPLVVPEDTRAGAPAP